MPRAPRSPESLKPKYFYSYVSVMADLRISRRTLQRWIDDMGIEPLEFEDQLKVFLTLPHVECLREYATVMRSKNTELIDAYRNAVEIDDASAIMDIRKRLSERNI